MGFQDAMNAFFLPEDQDAFARSMGWQDMEQMAHYEDMEQEVPPMTDREAEEMIERESNALPVQGTVEYLAPPPSEILVLARQDSREVYDDEVCFCIDCRPDVHPMAGVY